jgi:hypothetical protein
MARGWESKSVEDQISSKESEPDKSEKGKLTPEQVQKRTKREGLLLARTHTLNDMENSKDSRYRALLERTLAHIDSELANLQ